MRGDRLRARVLAWYAAAQAVFNNDPAVAAIALGDEYTATRKGYESAFKATWPQIKQAMRYAQLHRAVTQLQEKS